MKRIDFNQISFLVTTIDKSLEDIICLIKNNGLTGIVLVGSQRAKTEITCFYKDESLDLTVYFQTSTGTSVNRNYLLSRTTTEYCFFLDDDITFLDKDLSVINKAFNKYKFFDFVFFDFVYKDKTRLKVKWRMKEKIKWIQMRSYGTNSVLYRTDFLRQNNLLFNENIGPGRTINSGEDGQFLMAAAKRTTKAFAFKKPVIEISYEEGSTWFSGYDGNFFINIGYSYRMTYGPLAKLLIIYTLIKHRRTYLKNKSLMSAYKKAIEGYVLYGKKQK